jgi:hypothetical protein
MAPAVAMFVFNRPDLTARVFERIAAARPARLLVVADGPRDDVPTDAARCAQVRQIATGVDWPCQVETAFSPFNMGCGRRVATGLDWVFAQVEDAIVLEDDCLPSASFFAYCAELLETYREDDRIGAILGANLVGHRPPDGASYDFSRYFCPWGWASWRRVWQRYDFRLATLETELADGTLARLFPEPALRAYWHGKFAGVRDRRIDTWDYQLGHALLRHGQLAVLPATNLVSNLGFGRPDAAHTTYDAPVANLPAGSLALPLRPPPAVAPAAMADAMFERLCMAGLPQPAAAAG